MIPSPALLLIFPLFCENYFLSMSTRKSENFDTLQGAYILLYYFLVYLKKIIDSTLCVAILSVSFMVKVLFLYFSFSLSLSTFSISITMIHKNNICQDKTNLFLMYIFQMMELFFTFRIKTVRCIRFAYIFVRSITSFRQNIG